MKKKNGNGENGEIHNAKDTEVIDAATGLPDKTPPATKLLGRDLSTVRQVRRAIANVIKGEANGSVEHNRAKGLVWMLRELAGVISDSELEARLQALENRAGQPGGLSGQRLLPERTIN